jgi:5-methylcytosine-specific restriction endonuclease McrA
MEHEPMLKSVSDDELLRRLAEVLRQSRRVEADLVAHLAEVDHRRLYARFAHPSMHAYCTEALHLSDAEAYLRIAAARASREHPTLLSMLRDGRLHLTAIGLLAPHLTAENRDAVLARAVHRSRRQVEELVAELAPRPDVASVIRRLPARSSPDELRSNAVEPRGVKSDTQGAGGEAAEMTVATAALVARPAVVVSPRAPAAAPVHRGSIEPIAPARFKVQFTASAELRDKLERLRALMRASVPDGDIGTVIGAAVTQTLERLEARRFGSPRRRAKEPRTITSPAAPGAESSEGAARKRPRSQGAPKEALPHAAVSQAVSSGAEPPGVAGRNAALRAGRPVPSTHVDRSDRSAPSSRHVPAAVRRAVYERDGGRCRFVDENARRCAAREGLEFHHSYPFGHGGGHGADNLRLLCRAHNQHVAQHDYGREAMERCRRGAAPTASPTT